jgi:hypothetical protein
MAGGKRLEESTVALAHEKGVSRSMVVEEGRAASLQGAAGEDRLHPAVVGGEEVEARPRVSDRCRIAGVHRVPRVVAGGG